MTTLLSAKTHIKDAHRNTQVNVAYFFITLLLYLHPLRQLVPAYTIADVKLSEGVIMSNLENAVQELREKRDRAQMEVEKLNQVISGIESLNGFGLSQQSIGPKRTISPASRRKMALAQRARWETLRKESQSVSAGTTPSFVPAKHTMSAATRKKISLAQKARWAKANGQATAAKPKRHISAAGKKRIGAAARARWAKFRAAKKK